MNTRTSTHECSKRPPPAGNSRRSCTARPRRHPGGRRARLGNRLIGGSYTQIATGQPSILAGGKDGSVRAPHGLDAPSTLRHRHRACRRPLLLALLHPSTPRDRSQPRRALDTFRPSRATTSSERLPALRVARRNSPRGGPPRLGGANVSHSSTSRILAPSAYACWLIPRPVSVNAIAVPSACDAAQSAALGGV